MTFTEEQTDTMYLSITQPSNRSDKIVEVFIKERRYVWYAVLSYSRVPSKSIIIRDTYATKCKSPRPYKPGQACDGSITACVYHLYNQLCVAWGLDPLALYSEAYDDVILTKDQFNEILRFAEWEGVYVVDRWTSVLIEMTLESLHEVNMHQLANLLEEKIIL